MSHIEDNSELLEYYTTDGIWFFSDAPTFSYLIRKLTSVSKLRTSDTYKGFVYSIRLTSNIQIYNRYPASIISTLAKIGGIKALVGLALISLRLIHEWLFERRLQREEQVEYH